MKVKMKPESLMMSYGYHPEWSEGALKCPIFQTSTFVFKSAEEGKASFELAYGLRKKSANEQEGMIYSRINNPDIEILEKRLCLWDEAEDAAVFGSGMAAITTTLLEFLKPGDMLLASSPLYGGTEHFIHNVLVKHGIHVLEFQADNTFHEIVQTIRESGLVEKLSLILVESPANPTNDLIDLQLCSRIKEYFTGEANPVLVVDNTYLGPLWQHPLQHGADIVLYSATKYISGHSDIIAGACLGSKQLITRLKQLRTLLGNSPTPWIGWLLMRSLETLKIRMETQVRNASLIARYLIDHPLVEKVNYLEFLRPEDGKMYKTFKRQCLTAGAMISFYIKGGEKEAFRFLNHLHLIKLAVSLGGTESLAQHPATMTHAGLDPLFKASLGIDENLIRLSIGIENPDDLIHDIETAFEAVYRESKVPSFSTTGELVQ